MHNCYNYTTSYIARYELHNNRYSVHYTIKFQHHVNIHCCSSSLHDLFFFVQLTDRVWNSLDFISLKHKYNNLDTFVLILARGFE